MNPEDPRLHALAGLGDVDRVGPLVVASSGRLAGGALAGAMAIPFYPAGVWHLFRGLAPAGRRWALPPTLLLFAGFSLAPVAHGSFYFVGELYRAAADAPEGLRGPLVELAGRFTRVLLVDYAASAVLCLFGFGWLTAAVASSRTLHPRWFALTNPIAWIVVCAVAHRLAPEPVSHLFRGAGINLGLLGFFTLSTSLLWTAPRPAPPPGTSSAAPAG